jgi:hypothetical protein
MPGQAGPVPHRHMLFTQRSPTPQQPAPQGGPSPQLPDGRHVTGASTPGISLLSLQAAASRKPMIQSFRMMGSDGASVPDMGPLGVSARPCYGPGVRFALGLVLGVLLGAAGMYLYSRVPSPPAGVADAAPPPPPTKKRKVATSRPSTSGAAPDLRPVTVGDVTRPEQTIDMQGGESRDLGQAEIDTALSAHRGAIESCLTTARDAIGAGGRVTCAMLVGPDGRVAKTRVEAPRALVDAGLATCLRQTMSRIRFPAAGGQSIVTLPLEID